MNWMYLVAGTLAAGGVVFHGVWGYAEIAARLEADALPASALGDGRETLWMLRLAWHALTAIFVVMAVVLLRMGLDDSPDTVAPRAFATMLGLLAFGWVVGGGSLRRFRHPGLAVVLAATTLTIAGSL